jgi:lipopolysaccharide transport system ATP-binding protein
MTDTIIEVENLGKRYVLDHQQEREKYTALRDVIAQGVKSALKGFGGKKTETKEEFWALKDVSFEVKRGEVVGIIGRNGAGKSTLLKILSRITEPTTGRVRLKGRVASLLEVGTGFHPELTGRENIYLNGAVLGMMRQEIDRKFDEIVAFAEVEKFLDTPVKRYSSGMYVRLAFAVAAHLEPEILVVDEVLAVGDAAFQKKCLGKMGDVASKEGRTVLFVSHNMAAVQSLCQKGIWLNDGQVVRFGDVTQVTSDYLQVGYTNTLEKVWDDFESAPGNDKVKVRRVAVCPDQTDSLDNITVATPIKLIFECWNFLANSYLNLSVVIYNLEEVCIFNTVSSSHNFSQGLIRGIFYIPGNLLNDGIYKIRLLVVQDTSIPLLDISDILTFEVKDISRQGSWYGKWLGAIRPQLDWSLELVSSLN